MPMATTTRLDLPQVRAVLSGVVAATSPVIGRLALGALLVCAAHDVFAQSFALRPAFQVKSVTTSNVSFSTAELAESDSLLILTPRLDFVAQNPSYRLNAALSADAVSYLGRSRVDRVLPRAQADISAQLVERWLFVDGALSAVTTASDPFGVIEEESATVFNRANVYRERISPYIDRELSPSERVQLRSDHSWTQSGSANGASSASDTALQSQLVSYALQPQPLGLRVEYRRQASSFSNLQNSDVVFDTARVSALYQLAPQLVLTAVGGRDHGQYGTNDQVETLVGTGLRWTPTERTSFDALVEKRFFGTGWTVNLSHRTPFAIVNASLVQQATTYAAQVAALPAGGDVAQLLDSILSTRIVNPAERSLAVQQLITQRGLPATLAGAQSLFSSTAQLQKAANVSVALLGIRHTVTLRGFYTLTQDLLGVDLPPLVSSNTRQYGTSLTLSRRLQPDTTADTSFSRTRVVGFGSNAGVLTNNTSIRFGASRLLSPRTTLSAALRRQRVTSTSISDASQTSLTFGLLHRF
jgi:uncharacterized protein (PEP-CTERM system associated)